MEKFENVILGGGVAAGYAAREYAERGGEPGSLCVVSAEERVPYDRPPLSKDVLMGEMDVEEATIEETEFYAEHGIETMLGDRVVEVDLEARRLTTAAGREIGFNRLLVATGSRVRRFDLPGADLANLFYLRTSADAERILAAAEDAERAVVIGGGFIGTEVAASLTEHGLEVSLVYLADRLLKDRPFTPEMSAFYERAFGERGVELAGGEEVARFAGQARVDRVVLASGREIETDLVVAGIGVVPEIRLFEGTGIEIDDGIVVDERLETAVSGVWAGGDVARWPDRIFGGRRRRVEHWDNAMAQGQHWARLVTGEDAPFEHLIYFFSDAFDLSWEYWGDREGADDVVYRGDVEDGAFSAWWLAAGRLVAAFVMDRPDEEREAAQEWIREGRRVDRARLTDPDRSLTG